MTENTVTVNPARLRYWADFNCIEPGDLMLIRIGEQWGGSTLAVRTYQQIELFDGDGLTYQAQVVEELGPTRFMARIDRTSGAGESE